MFCGFLNDLSLFLPLQVSDPPKKKEKFLPQLHSAPDGLFRCCPRQSCTRFRSQLSADYYWKAYHICQTQDTANLPLPELSMAGTWASARKSFVTGWFAGFISVCWWSLNIFQMCWPHKPATGCERTSPRLYFSHPSTIASPWDPGWVAPYVLKLGWVPALSLEKTVVAKAAQQKASFAPVKPSLFVPPGSKPARSLLLGS